MGGAKFAAIDVGHVALSVSSLTHTVLRLELTRLSWSQDIEKKIIELPAGFQLLFGFKFTKYRHACLP